DQRLKGSDRRALDVMVGSSHDNRASSNRIIATFVLTGWKDVTRQRSGQDTGGQERERVGKGRAAHVRRIVTRQPSPPALTREAATLCYPSPSNRPCKTSATPSARSENSRSSRSSPCSR